MKEKTTSAGLLMCRRGSAGWEFLLVHPGGPFFRKKDEGAWTIPKGLVEAGEDLLLCAQREFGEETGFACAGNHFVSLGHVVQKGGKIVHAWAFEGTCEPAKLASNTFVLEWPPGSGQEREFPEVDRAEFFAIEPAKQKIMPAQLPFLERAMLALDAC